MKTTLSRDDIKRMFLELNYAQDRDPWDTYEEWTQGAQGIICAIRAIAENEVEAEDVALELLDYYREERFMEE